MAFVAREIEATLGSQAEWRAFAVDNQWAGDRAYIDGLVRTVAQRGIRSRFHGEIRAAEVSIEGANYRETITARGCNSRTRAVLDELFNATAGDEQKRIL